MKQFIVDRHTTPNTPALVQVPTEKIPVYDDLDAVTADLANLTAGQIGSTKDTGTELSQPVDAVQSGNLHAVTSNAVAESLSYYTTEQATGGKWIDGKPIYRLVYSGVVADIGNNVDTALSSSLDDKNVDKIVKLQGFVNFVSNNLIEPMPSMYIRLFYATQNKIIYINNKLSSASTNNIITFIAEYTKTTE